MPQGKVKKFSKSYGFIVHEGQDIFVHFSDIESDEEHKSLKEGDVVQFDIKETEKGLRAVHVKIIEPAKVG